jgi:hypothetical protein
MAIQNDPTMIIGCGQLICSRTGGPPFIARVPHRLRWDWIQVKTEGVALEDPTAPTSRDEDTSCGRQARFPIEVDNCGMEVLLYCSPLVRRWS